VPDHDVRTEEDELLPRMQELLSPRRLRLLAWQDQVLSALPLTVLNHARRPAAAARRGHPLPVHGTALGTERLLATAAGAVERAPVLPGAERAET
jgi:hypothetical protein